MSLLRLCFCVLLITACGIAASALQPTPTQPPPLVYFIETPTPTPAVTPIPPTPTATPILPTATMTSPTVTPTVTPLPPTTTRPRPTATFTARPPTATPLPPASPQPSAQPKAPTTLSEDLNADEQQMLTLINAERAKRGVPPLVTDPTFQTVARMRTADMLARGFFSHNDPKTGERVAKAMLLKLGLNTPSGENFYWGRPYDPQFVERVMRWFMSDPPHRDNIISSRWNVVGVSVMRGANDTVIAVQNFGMR